MIIGIVGSEAIKFTKNGAWQANYLIRNIIKTCPEPVHIVSGACHLGGIDIWAIDAAKDLQVPYTEFPPTTLNWEGYKERNLKIATISDIVHCITVDRYPPDYNGMRFKLCYHCKTDTHIKSGGCWTMKRAKLGELHVIENI